MALDFVGLALLLTVLGLTVAAAMNLLRRRLRAAAVIAAANVVALGALLAVAVTVPAEVWPIILAAYDDSSGAAQEQRKGDLEATWHYGQMTVVRWLALSSKWNVCHTLWREKGCRMPSGPYEAQGIAKEILGNLAAPGGSRYPTISKWTGVPGRGK